MEIEAVGLLVSELGFPVAITIALFYQNTKNNEILKNMEITINKLVDTLNRVGRD